MPCAMWPLRQGTAHEAACKGSRRKNAPHICDHTCQKMVSDDFFCGFRPHTRHKHTPHHWATRLRFLKEAGDRFLHGFLPRAPAAASCSKRSKRACMSSSTASMRGGSYGCVLHDRRRPWRLSKCSTLAPLAAIMAASAAGKRQMSSTKARASDSGHADSHDVQDTTQTHTYSRHRVITRHLLTRPPVGVLYQTAGRKALGSA